MVRERALGPPAKPSLAPQHASCLSCEGTEASCRLSVRNQASPASRLSGACRRKDHTEVARPWWHQQCSSMRRRGQHGGSLQAMPCGACSGQTRHSTESMGAQGVMLGATSAILFPGWIAQAGSPVHGINQWPAQRPSFNAALQLYLQHCLRVGQAIMRGGGGNSVAISLACMRPCSMHAVHVPRSASIGNIHVLLAARYCGQQVPLLCGPAVLASPVFGWCLTSTALMPGALVLPEQALRWAWTCPRTTLRPLTAGEPRQRPRTGWHAASTTHPWRRCPRLLLLLRLSTGLSTFACSEHEHTERLTPS